MFAKTDPEAGHRGMSCFIVDRNTPGVSISKKFDKLGQRASDTAEVVFENVEVPEDFGFELEESGETSIILYYLHPNPEDETVGVFQLNIYENDTLIDDSLLLFIDADGNIVLWTDQGFWAEQLAQNTDEDDS